MTKTTRTDDDHLYLTRPQIQALTDLLRKVPALAEDLAITETRQDRVTKSGLAAGIRHGRPGPKLPMKVSAFEAGCELHNALTGWIRLVCEQRAIAVPAAVYDVMSASRWLIRHVYALAMTEGAESAVDDIRYAMDLCADAIDLPPEDEITFDSERLAAANNSVLTAYQVEKLAAKLGEYGKGLNRDRVRYLARRGLREVGCGEDETKFYRLGDVLAAHMRHKAKGKGWGAA